MEIPNTIAVNIIAEYKKKQSTEISTLLPFKAKY